MGGGGLAAHARGQLQPKPSRGARCAAKGRLCPQPSLPDLHCPRVSMVCLTHSFPAYLSDTLEGGHQGGPTSCPPPLLPSPSHPLHYPSCSLAVRGLVTKLHHCNRITPLLHNLHLAHRAKPRIPPGCSHHWGQRKPDHVWVPLLTQERPQVTFD